MRYSYTPTGVCSRKIEFDLEDGIVKNVEFIGGCAGNTKGISKLAEDMPADELIKRLDGIPCGFRPTSCPDQFAKALKEAISK